VTKVSFREVVKVALEYVATFGETFDVYEFVVVDESGEIFIGEVADNDFMICFDDRAKAVARFGYSSQIFGIAGVVGCEVPGIVITEEDQELSQIRIRNERIN